MTDNALANHSSGRLVCSNSETGFSGADVNLRPLYVGGYDADGADDIADTADDHAYNCSVSFFLPLVVACRATLLPGQGR